MKNFLKKILSVILSLLIISATVVCAFAEDDILTEKKEYPKVYVPGFMSTTVYVDASDPDSEQAWPLSTNSILTFVKNLALPISELATNGDWNKFADSIVPFAEELFEPVTYGYSGEAVNTSGIRFEYPEPNDAKESSYFRFGYDWRADPLQSASELNDYINYILEQTGAEKVVMECHSLGGIIALSYFKLFGTASVKSIVLDSTAIYGETYTGEMLSGEINVNDKALNYYLDYAFDGMSVDTLLSMLIGTLTDAGAIGFVCDYANDILELIYDRLELSAMAIFANWPTIWAMIPDEMLSDAEQHIFGDVYKNANVDYSELQAKVTAYNETVRKDKTQTLRAVNNNLNLYVISRTGYSSLPMTASWENLSDGVIDTKNNSFGATTAKYKETLNVPASEYLSPDKNIDASTSLFPEQTWFIKNIKHSETFDCLDVFYEELLYYDGQATVNTFAEYPRYMELDRSNDALVADNGTNDESFIYKLFAAFLKIIAAIIKLAVFGG